jgi:hypothetical protein
LSHFSERMGFKPVKTTLQVESMDQSLRNRLWNNFTIYLIHIRRNQKNDTDLVKVIRVFLREMWDNYFKVPLDSVSLLYSNVRNIIRQHFFKCEWNEVYDLMEYFAEHYPDQETTQHFIESCNKILEEKLAGYRFIGNKIAPIISAEEIGEIEEALTTPFTAVTTHLKTALDLFSDREAPEYRNSIKESISAVESICNLITGTTHATLGQCIKRVEDQIGIHPALKAAFSALYGYTSSAEGIRHALLEEATLESEDAKFMLVSCSAFINYLKLKSSKAGITF